MSWLYSRALAEAYSGVICSDGGPCAPSSETDTPQAYCWPDKTTEPCRPSRSGMTFAHLTASHGEALLTSYLEASRAKISPSPEPVVESTGHGVGSGDTWRELSVRFDRGLCSWRTHRCLFPEVWPESSVTLPRSGMMHDGRCWALMRSAHHTGAIGCGLLLPTLTVQDAKNNGGPSQARRDTVPLNSLVGGPVSPSWAEWLMGWPIGWTDLQPLEMDKYRQWLHAHSPN